MQIGESVDALQNLLMAFRFAPKPVVAAPHGQTLGGGLEVCLHSDRIVAAGETYMGLVEVGVGLIPAGGGTKEMARRLVSPPLHTAPDTPPLPFLQKAFEQIALAKTATSALEAKEMGFLTEDDRIVMNADHLISAAKREVLDLADGYTPPEHGNNVYAAGRTARAALEMGVKTMQWGHYASDVRRRHRRPRRPRPHRRRPLAPPVGPRRIPPKAGEESVPRSPETRENPRAHRSTAEDRKAEEELACQAFRLSGSSNKKPDC